MARRQVECVFPTPKADKDDQRAIVGEDRHRAATSGSMNKLWRTDAGTDTTPVLEAIEEVEGKQP